MANRAYPELASAMCELLNRIDKTLVENGYTGQPIKMFLAGGMAINYWCGSRYTEDIDASFSRRVHLDAEDMIIRYQKPDGTETFIYLDQNYNTTFALMHEDHEDDAVSWDEINNDSRKISLFVLNPLDLAVSKISRFHDRDREDIKALASLGLIKSEDLKNRAEDAMSCFVGNLQSLKTSINLACKDVHEIESNWELQIKHITEKQSGTTQKQEVSDCDFIKPE